MRSGKAQPDQFFAFSHWL